MNGDAERIGPDDRHRGRDASPRLPAWLSRALAIWFLIAVAYATLDLPSLRNTPGPLALAFSLETDAGGHAQVFFDRGAGFREEDSSTLEVTPGPAPHPLRFTLGAGTIRRLRIDPLNGSDAAFTLRDPCLVEVATGRRVVDIPLNGVLPNGAIASMAVAARSLSVTPKPEANDAFVVVAFDPAIRNGPTAWDRAAQRLPAALGWFVALFVAQGLVSLGFKRRGGAGERLLRRAFAHLSKCPLAALACVALASVVVCCHPVIFGGRSLVSPDVGLPLLYPIAPEYGYDATRGSDTGAMLWQHLPYSVVQARALLDEHTLPLWNRFNSCGVPLLGQGQSMLGDPFHLPVVLARGASWAWDAKFVVARFLFACGLGWSAFLATRRLGASALLALAGPFIGFFSFRWDHPAYVSLCYAPWILVGWLGLAQAARERSALHWMAVIFLATWCEATSGTVKEATMLAAGLNLVGLLAVCLTPRPRELGRFIAPSLAFLATAGLLLSAPLWMTFLDTLGTAMTSSDAAPVLRMSPDRLAGLFDGMFYSERAPGREVVAPSVNLVVLVGCLCFLGHPGRWRSSPTTVLCLVGSIGCLSLAFDTPWLPNRWISALPGLRSIGHHFNVFSCIAIPLVSVVAAQGFAWFMAAPPAHRIRDVGVVALGLTALVVVSGLDLAAAWHAQGTPYRWSAWWLDHGIFLRITALLAVCSLALLAALHFFMYRSQHHVAAAVLGLGSLVPLLARHGQVMESVHRDFFVVPQHRASLATETAGTSWLKQRLLREPARIFGMGGYLFPGFASVHGFEGPNGPDGIFSVHYRELVEASGWVRPGDWLLPLDRREVEAQRTTLDMLNVRWLVTSPDVASPEPSWLRVAQDADFRILENPGAWPRAFFCDSAVMAATANDLIRLLHEGDGRPFVALSPADAAPSPPAIPDHGRTVVAATGYRLGINETAFDITTPGSGWVALTETWFPGAFTATVDGKPARCLRVNHAFKGVRIETAGTHRIEFTYRPPRWTLSLFMFGAGIVMLVTFVSWGMRRGRTHAGAVRLTERG